MEINTGDRLRIHVQRLTVELTVTHAENWGDQSGDDWYIEGTSAKDGGPVFLKQRVDGVTLIEQVPPPGRIYAVNSDVRPLARPAPVQPVPAIQTAPGPAVLGEHPGNWTTWDDGEE